MGKPVLFSQTGTYSLTALVYHDESLQGIKKLYTYIYFTCILQIVNSGYMENQMHQMYNKNMEWIAYAFCPI